MKEIAIFTIVSNNYFSRAVTLMNSVVENKIQSDNFIILADEKNDICNYNSDEYKMIYLNEINCKKIDEMKFKYDVVEFNTAIKPFVLKDFFNKGYKKVFYIDPDICLYSNIDELLNILDEKSIVLTPHTVLPNMAEGIACFNEVQTSAAGCYNLGFCGLKNSEIGNKAVDWWCNKLQDYCYTDFKFGLFYDQKWMNFMPCFFPNDTYIMQKPGYNFAPWNFHERKVSKNENNNYLVTDLDGNKSDLVFLHFSGFNPHKPMYELIPGTVNEESFVNISQLCNEYATKVLENNFENTTIIPYAFNHYNNGDNITTLHRQLYRKLLHKGYMFDNLFDAQTGDFYKLMKKSKLLCNEKEIIKMRNVSNFDGKAKKANSILRIGKKILGIKKWQMLMRYMQYASRFDNQDFLINEKVLSQYEKNN